MVSLAEEKPWPDPRYFAAAPTRDQAKRIFWRDLKGLVPEEWKLKVYETDLRITTTAGSELWVVGLDKPERIEGIPWDGGVLDEYANMKPRAWTSNVRPALSDRQGWCWFTGVPEGLDHYKELADYATSSGDPDWAFYTWPSAEILPASEVEAARRQLDARTFRQEYEASFEGSSGRVYYPYSAERHQDPAIKPDPELPLILCCDFNVDPCVWEVVQTDAKAVRVVDEVVQKNTSTAEMAREFLDRYGRWRPGISVYGDAAGSSRSTAGQSDYAILRDFGLTDQRLNRANPPVRDRVNSVNSMLENHGGEARLLVHPRCAYLIKDFETVEWAPDGRHLDKSNNERTHAADALGYFIEYEFPLRALRPDPSLKFYK